MTETKAAARAAAPSLYQANARESFELCKQARQLLEGAEGEGQKMHEAFSKLANARELLRPHASKAKKQLSVINDELENMSIFFSKHPYNALGLSDNKNHSVSSIKKKIQTPRPKVPS